MTESYLAALPRYHTFCPSCPKIQGAGPGLPPATALPLSVRAAGRFPGHNIAIAHRNRCNRNGAQKSWGHRGHTRGQLSLKYSNSAGGRCLFQFFGCTEKYQYASCTVTRYSHSPSKFTTPSIIQLFSQTAMAFHCSSSDPSSAKRVTRPRYTRPHACRYSLFHVVQKSPIITWECSGMDASTLCGYNTSFNKFLLCPHPLS